MLTCWEQKPKEEREKEKEGWVNLLYQVYITLYYMATYTVPYIASRTITVDTFVAIQKSICVGCFKGMIVDRTFTGCTIGSIMVVGTFVA